jgi:hypothetical protein
MSAWSRFRPWILPGLVTGTAALILVLQRLSIPRPFGGFKFWLVPVVFLYAPLVAAWASDKDFAAIGLGRPDPGKALADVILFILVILPVFLVSWWALFRFGFGAAFRPQPLKSPFGLVAWQLLGVALPEEVFFRGYVQGRLNILLGRNWRFPGTRVGPGLFITSVIFALSHYLTQPAPVRLLVLFPGLLFGYMRERSGSVAAPVIVHAAANCAFLTLQSWFA